jgi:transposase
MFVRKKKNRSGTTSVVVVDKTKSKFKEVKVFGISDDKDKIEALFQEAKNWVSEREHGLNLFRVHQNEVEEQQLIGHLLSNIEQVLLNGSHLLLNQVFKKVGFDAIEDTIFKALTIARLCEPLSKAGTVEYLKSHFDEDIQLHKIYRYLDKLYHTQQEKIQQISVEHTRKILGGHIGLMFYDVTTLYFEAENGDDLRQSGFSKDGKHSQPQIVLGLLASKDGYPLSYSIFNGSQFESRTMIPIIDDFKQRFKTDDFVIVADSGLINKLNIKLLQSGNYKYIIGARIKNESAEITNWLLNIDKKDGRFYETPKDNNRLIVGFSEKRAKKDKFNRNKGIKRLTETYKSGKITKDKINKKGYNKFLEISDNITVKINNDKIEEDEKWDGLKGYITNTNLSAEEVYNQYSNLWEIERAYRITKGKIEMRPMFLFNPERIQAHICICFAAYKIYKELERVIKLKKINYSVEQVLNIAKTVTTLKVKLPSSGQKITKTMFLSPKQKAIEPLFTELFWNSI